jgi:dipeptidyl aminopeptidase/acylaminoacyl peptidase
MARRPGRLTLPALIFTVFSAVAVDVSGAVQDAKSCVTPNGMAAPGVESVPAALLAQIAPYTKFRSSHLLDWHPSRGAAFIKQQSADGEGIGRLLVLKPPPSTATLVPSSLGEVVNAKFATVDDWILILHQASADAPPVLSRLNLTSGETTPLSPLGEDVNAVAVARHDGRVAFLTSGVSDGSQPTTSRLYIGDAGRISKDKQPESLVKTSAPVGVRWRDLKISVDGRALVYVEQSTAGESLWTRDIASGVVNQVTRAPPKDVRFFSPQFSAEGKSVLVLSSSQTGRINLLKIDRENGETKNLTQHLKGDVIEFDVSSKNSVALTTLESGSAVLRFFELSTEQEQLRPALFDGEIRHLRWQPDAEVLGFSMASARTPLEVYTYELKTTKLLRWTNGAVAGLNAFNFPEPRSVEWPSGGGKSVGHLWAPDASLFPSKRPVIVSLHGNVAGDAATGFIGAANYLVVENGYAIVRPAAMTTPSILSLIEWIKRQPDLDATRIAIVADAAAAVFAVELLRHHGTMFVAAIIESREAIAGADLKVRLLHVQTAGKKLARSSTVNVGAPDCASRDNFVPLEARADARAAARVHFLEKAFRENKKGGQ